MIALYARQSVERENSVSIETQLDYCRAMIKPDERQKPAMEYIDEGCSGGNVNRDGFQRMLGDIRRGKIEKVITYKLDRISRSLNDFVGILQTFREHHVEFVSSQEAFDTSSVYGDLILKILMVFAEFERTSIINRVRDAYAKRTDLGLYMGGRRQYGFTPEDAMRNGIRTKCYVPVPEELEQVRYLFERYAEESVSLRRVLAELVEKGIHPLTGKAWTTARISSLLRNPVYVQSDSGIYDYFHERGVRMVDPPSEFDGTRAAFFYGKNGSARKGESDRKLVLASHAGIIPAKIWLRCQHKLEQNRQLGNSLSNHTSWLAGKVVCAKCGYTMTTIKSARSDGSYRRYFNCTGKSARKTCTGTRCTIYAEDIEALLNKAILEKLSQVPPPVQTESPADLARQNALTLQIRAIEAQEKALGDCLADGGITPALFQVANDKATELFKQKQCLVEKLRKPPATEPQKDASFTAAWQSAGFEEKKAVCGILLRGIVIDEDGSPEIIWNF